jgi:serine/threonine protein kinase
MALSKHPNVLKVYGSFVNGAKLYIATPYLSGGKKKKKKKNKLIIRRYLSHAPK